MRYDFYLCILLNVGSLSLLAQTNYVANTAAGSSAAPFNTLVGVQAGANINSSGESNVFTGYQAGFSNTSGKFNVFTGLGAGYNNTTGTQSVAVGYQAGVGGGSGVVVVGYQAGKFNTGSNNVFIGSQSGYSNTSGGGNTFIGYYAGYYNTAVNNTFIGLSAGVNNTIGNGNTFVGSSVGFSNSTGGSNTFLGSSAGSSSLTGSYNTFLGALAGINSQTGNNNTFLGYSAGVYVTTGSNNIIIGPNSGTAITDGNDNVLMGYNSQADEGIFNGIAIGSNSRVAASNSLILGNEVNVGIGTSNPQRKLEVVADEAGQSGLRLTQLTNQNKAIHSTDQFLTVNEKGDVVKARYQLRINSLSEWSDNVFASSYQLSSLPSVAAFINQHGHLPGIPSAEQVVKEGIDLVKMNATLLEKIEELTLYSIQLEKTNQTLQQENRQRQKENQQQQTEIDELKRLVNQLLDKK
ncbi:hypothetical protein [Spirosoma gilvum]